MSNSDDFIENYGEELEGSPYGDPVNDYEDGREQQPLPPQEENEPTFLTNEAQEELREIKNMMTEFMAQSGDVSVVFQEVTRLKKTLEYTLKELEETQKDLSDLSKRHSQLKSAYQAFYKDVTGT